MKGRTPRETGPSNRVLQYFRLLSLFLAGVVVSAIPAPGQQIYWTDLFSKVKKRGGSHDDGSGDALRFERGVQPLRLATVGTECALLHQRNLLRQNASGALFQEGRRHPIVGRCALYHMLLIPVLALWVGGNGSQPWLRWPFCPSFFEACGESDPSRAGSTYDTSATRRWV